MKDIKSMFAANKTKTVQRQEQVDLPFCFCSSNEYFL
jgi:hypothetical protein